MERQTLPLLLLLAVYKDLCVLCCSNQEDVYYANYVSPFPSCMFGLVAHPTL